MPYNNDKCPYNNDINDGSVCQGLIPYTDAVLLDISQERDSSKMLFTVP